MEKEKLFNDMTQEEKQEDIERLQNRLADIIGYNMSSANSASEVDDTTGKMLGILAATSEKTPERREELGAIMRKAMNESYFNSIRNSETSNRSANVLSEEEIKILTKEE